MLLEHNELHWRMLKVSHPFFFINNIIKCISITDEGNNEMKTIKLSALCKPPAVRRALNEAHFDLTAPRVYKYNRTGVAEKNLTNSTKRIVRKDHNATLTGLDTQTVVLTVQYRSLCRNMALRWKSKFPVSKIREILKSAAAIYSANRRKMK